MVPSVGEFKRNLDLPSVFFLILGGFFALPERIFVEVYLLDLLSGLFSNTVGFVTMKALGVPFDHVIFGFLLISISVLPFIIQERSSAIQALFSASISIYGIISLFYLILDPMPMTRIQVIGVGLQVIFFGLLAVFIKERTLKTNEFSIEYDRKVYLTAFLLVFTGIGSLTYFSSIFQFETNVGAYILLLSSVYWVVSIYGSYELLDKTSIGFWLTMTGLIMLFVSSLLSFGSRVGGIIALSFMIILWDKKAEFGDIEQPISKVKTQFQRL